MRKIGVADSEFTNPGGTGRINLYVGFEGRSSSALVRDRDARRRQDQRDHADRGRSSSAATRRSPSTTWSSSRARAGSARRPGEYVFNQQTGADVAVVDARADYQRTSSTTPTPAGASSPPTTATSGSSTTRRSARRRTGASTSTRRSRPNQTGYINTAFPKGLELAEWLQNIGASTTPGQIPINTLRWDINANGVNDPPSRSSGCRSRTRPRRRADALHVQHPRRRDAGDHPVRQGALRRLPRRGDVTTGLGLDNGVHFPSECPAGAMTPQEKLLEFMIFDLGSCVAPDEPDLHAHDLRGAEHHCGPAGDGCGNDRSSAAPAPPARRAAAAAPRASAARRRARRKTCAAAGHSAAARPATAAANSSTAAPARAGQTCGGGGMPGVCGSRHLHAEDLRGAGHQLRPGGRRLRQRRSTAAPARAGQTCGGGGKPGVCGAPPCTPEDLRRARLQLRRRPATAAATSSSAAPARPADLRRRRHARASAAAASVTRRGPRSSVLRPDEPSDEIAERGVPLLGAEGAAGDHEEPRCAVEEDITSGRRRRGHAVAPADVACRWPERDVIRSSDASMLIVASRKLSRCPGPLLRREGPGEDPGGAVRKASMAVRRTATPSAATAAIRPTEDRARERAPRRRHQDDEEHLQAQPSREAQAHRVDDVALVVLELEEDVVAHGLPGPQRTSRVRRVHRIRFA